MTPTWPGTLARELIAEARFARSGAALFVHPHERHRDPACGPPLREGVCVEVLAARPGDGNGS